MSPAENPKISVVIPCRNEERNLAFLLDEVERALAGRPFEIIVVDDGSTDGTRALVTKRMGLARSPVRLISHDRSAGQSAAVRSGLFAASGDIVATMDGDGQNDPAYIPKLVDALLAGGPGTGIVAGQRLKRTDPKLKQLSSSFANRLREKMLHDGTRDSGCGLKAVPTALFRQLPYFDGWHRYLPALVLREGYRIVHVDVIDRQRRHGKSNYGILDRGWRGVLDLIGVWWLRRRRKVLPEIREIRP
ncbi:MAG: glycosyltransferase family 2 protein [Rhizobiaceae bacterium]